MEPIHIYAKQQSSRLTYIADYFFTTLLPFEKIIFYTHIDSFQAAQGIKLNYSNQNISDVLQIIPHTILFEDAIAPQSFKVEKWNGMKAFFKTGNDSLPFDLLAASFYLITRYEEYLPFEADAHQRFPANQSLAYRENFLHLPLIQYYANILYSNLAAKHNLPPTPDKTVINSPGIDVDNAYAYLHKGATRTLGGIGKDMLKFDFANLAHRIRSLLTNKDPYDTYEFILRSCKEQSVTPTFFLMTANQGTYDRNLPHTNATYIKLIQQLSLQATTGLHPGYTSDELQILKTETARLEEITGASIVNSRQHFENKISINL
ncbi:MAG: hypothetical protein IPO27_11680 [Bacteroidetes bacterium]|nr:hypothetical protein [Bacteroidota bacterium]